MKTKAIVYLNGKFLPEEEAKISISDAGFLYGDGLFETMRAFRGRIFRLEEHLERLFSAGKIIGLKIPLSLEKLKKIVLTTVEKNNFSDAYIRLTVTHGERGNPTIAVLVKDFRIYAPRKSTWNCVIVQNVRQNEFSPLSRIKSLNYLTLLLARKEAESKGADEGILLNTKGEICEGTRTNIFVITENGVLNTPPIECGCLPGITRKAVIELAQSLKLEVREKRIKIEDLKKAKEIFLTNSLIGVMPVTKIDGRVISGGKPGPLTLKIQQVYQNLIRVNS